MNILDLQSNKKNSAVNAALPVVLLFMSSLLIFSPIIRHMSRFAYDYVVHTSIAEQMLANHTLFSPHFLLQAVIILFRSLLQTDFGTSCFLTVLLAIMVTATMLYNSMCRATSGRRLLSVSLSMALLLVAPIPVLAPLDGHLYFGYIAASTYHNPTILLLKPFALVVSGFLFNARAEYNTVEWKTLAVCVLMTVSCALVKPSYIIVIVPALIIAVGYRHVNRTLDRSFLIVAIAILFPSLCILAGQYWIAYSAQQLPGVYEGKSSIIFAPVKVMSYYSSWLTVKFVVSIAFPLSVAIAYIRQTVSDGRLCFAWLAFVIGTAYTYLLAESGPRMYQGNFVWSGQISLFLLFVASLGFLCEQVRLTKLNESFNRGRFAVCALIFVMHVISGLGFYAAEFFASEQYW